MGHRGGRRRTGAKRGQQLLRVLVDGQHPVALEQWCELTLHRCSVLEHVAGTRGRAEVVFEHEVLAVLVAHDVDARDMRIDAPGRVDVDHLAAKVLRAEDERGRNPAVAQDSLVVVDVVQEEVERTDPLDQAALDVGPFVLRDDARDQVEREDPLEAFLLAVDREADPLVEEREVDAVPPFLEVLGAEHRELLGEGAIVRSWHTGCLEHLVEERARLISAVEREDGCLRGGGHADLSG